MDSDQYSRLGDSLKETVNNAINSQDFRRLSSDISSMVNSTFNTLHSGINATGNKIKNTVSNIKQKQENTTYPINKHVFPRGYGMVLTILGIMGGIGFSFLTLILLVINIFANSIYAFIPAIVSGCAAVFFYLMTARGAAARRLKRHFDKYCAVMIGRTNYEIKYLSAQLQQTERKTVKELKKLVEMNAFPEGHIDFEKKYFIADDSTYEHYLSSISRQKELARKEENSSELEAVHSALEEGRGYIARIRQANIIILNDKMSDKLSDTELILTKIFERVESRPELLPDVRKLMEYYLPITQKLINAYIELDKQNINIDNIESSKHEIENSMDSINAAFYNLYNSLFQDDKIDIVSDISVLRSMFAQEGLNNTDFNNLNNKKG